jgi:hypothetical protein
MSKERAGVDFKRPLRPAMEGWSAVLGLDRREEMGLTRSSVREESMMKTDCHGELLNGLGACIVGVRERESNRGQRRLSLFAVNSTCIEASMFELHQHRRSVCPKIY